MSQRTANLIVWTGFIAVILLFIGGARLFASYACHARWPDDQTEYRWPSGCMVKVNGKLVPERRVRIDAESAE